MTNAAKIAYLLAHGWKKAVVGAGWYEVDEQQRAQAWSSRAVVALVHFYTLDAAYKRAQVLAEEEAFFKREKELDEAYEKDKP